MKFSVFLDLEAIDPVSVSTLGIKHFPDDYGAFTKDKQSTHEIPQIQIRLTLDQFRIIIVENTSVWFVHENIRGHLVKELDILEMS